ncbi:MAG: hypothetical protein NE327_10655 [Lentisphaeraceae bacterium]|nr:hypothetical protein [Lentisphaeraceae bacterium]
MKQMSPKEISRKLGKGDNSDVKSFIADFPEKLKEKVGVLLVENGNAILSELACMYSDDVKPEVPIVIKLKAALINDAGQFVVKGGMQFERKEQVKIQLKELQYDFDQPELPFGEEPTSEELSQDKTEEASQKNDMQLYNEVVDLLSGGMPCTVKHIVKNTNVSEKKAAGLVLQLQEGGIVGPQNDDGSYPVQIPQKKG